MPDLKTLVLAAGKSTRIASISGGQPKPLVQIAGESVLARNLRWLSTEGIRQVWINLHYKPEAIRAAIGDGSSFGLTVQYAYEPEILGTAGAVRNLSSEWEQTFLVVYGDSLIRLDLARLQTCHMEREALVSVALFEEKTHLHTGIAGGRVRLAADGRIEEFSEGMPTVDSPFVNAGVYMLEHEVVEEIPTGCLYDFGKDLFPRLLSKGRPIYGHVMTGYCLGIDTPDSYRQAVHLVESGKVTLS